MYNTIDIRAERIPTLEDNIQRFRKFGKLINRVAKNGTNVAKIGKIERENSETVYLVFYPDGEFDRFESGEKVKYRPGWVGPDLTTNRDDDDITEMILSVNEEITKEKELQSTKKSKVVSKKILTPEERERKNARARELYHLRKNSVSTSARSKVLH